MPFGVKILVGILGIGIVGILGSAAWGKLAPCTSSTTVTDTANTSNDTILDSTAQATVTTPSTSTDPCSSSSRRGLRSIFNSRSTTGGGTDVGK